MFKWSKCWKNGWMFVLTNFTWYFIGATKAFAHHTEEQDEAFLHMQQYRQSPLQEQHQMIPSLKTQNQGIVIFISMTVYTEAEYFKNFYRAFWIGTHLGIISCSFPTIMMMMLQSIIPILDILIQLAIWWPVLYKNTDIKYMHSHLTSMKHHHLHRPRIQYCSCSLYILLCTTHLLHSIQSRSNCHRNILCWRFP